MNKFEQVFSDGHQISLAGRGAERVPCLLSGGGGLGGPCTVRPNASWVMVR